MGLFIVALVVGALAWCVLAWNLVRLPFRAKPGVSVWSLSFNPYNIAFRPELLSVEGQGMRRRAYTAMYVFLGACAVGVAAGLTAQAMVP